MNDAPNDTALPGPGGESAVSAALKAARLNVQPASLMFLAEIVRSGGIAYAAALAEPLPGQDRSELARSWLSAAEATASTVDDDDDLARWLEAVATIVVAMAQSR